jgi:hypothetical protein
MRVHWVRWRRLIAAVFCGLLAAACDGYATKTEVRAVAERVEEVGIAQAGDASRLAADIRAASQRVALVEERQTAAEEVLSGMGDGFNVLADVVEDTRQDARRVADRQARLERRVDRRLAPLAIGRNEAPDVLVGAGEDIATGKSLVGYTLDRGTPVRLIRDAVGDRAPYVFFVREVGDRLYGVGDDGTPPVCFDVVERFEERAGFRAVICDHPFQLYEFRPR